MRPGSFRGVPFRVEDGRRGGGRRQAVFEFPKRDTPYAEDMGRRARRFTVRGYVVGPDYDMWRAALIAAMEREGPGPLVHYFLGEHTVSPDSYEVSETRQRGGYAEFSLQFVESGQSPSLGIGEATSAQLKGAAAAAADAVKKSGDEKIKKPEPDQVWT